MIRIPNNCFSPQFRSQGTLFVKASLKSQYENYLITTDSLKSITVSGLTDEEITNILADLTQEYNSQIG